jgi:hypothetical protein
MGYANYWVVLFDPPSHDWRARSGGDSDASDDESDDMLPTFKEEDEKEIDLTVDLDDALRDQSAALGHRAHAYDEVDEIAAALQNKKDKQVKTVVKKEEEEDQKTDDGQLTTNPWASTQALIKFRQSAEKVADEYIEAKFGKLKTGKSRKRRIGDYAAYQEGEEDSKKVDLKRRRIEEKEDGDD